MTLDHQYPNDQAKEASEGPQVGFQLISISIYLHFKMSFCLDLGDGFLCNIRVHGHTLSLPGCHGGREDRLPGKVGYEHSHACFTPVTKNKSLDYDLV